MCRAQSAGLFTDVSVIIEAAPVIFDDFQASILDFKPQAPLHITCLTIGSRGDVQPYIALCKELLEDGHHPVIATHAEFELWIRSHGIDFRSVAGDPGKIMKLCVENDMFTIKFMQEAQSVRHHQRNYFCPAILIVYSSEASWMSSS